MKNTEIYKRLYKDYSRKYLDKILLSGFFSILVAGSTSAIAWLLDPAIKKIVYRKGPISNSFNSLYDNHCFFSKRTFFIFCKIYNEVSLSVLKFSIKKIPYRFAIGVRSFGQNLQDGSFRGIVNLIIVFFVHANLV